MMQGSFARNSTLGGLEEHVEYVYGVVVVLVGNGI